MTRRDEERLDDIDIAITAIESHLLRGDISEGSLIKIVRVDDVGAELAEVVHSADEKSGARHRVRCRSRTFY